MVFHGHFFKNFWNIENMLRKDRIVHYHAMVIFYGNGKK